MWQSFLHQTRFVKTNFSQELKNRFKFLSLDFDSATPHEIKDFVKEGGSINQKGIDALTGHLNEDWVIDLNEAEFLFQVNATIGVRDEETEGWAEFFSENTSRKTFHGKHFTENISRSYFSTYALPAKSTKPKGIGSRIPWADSAAKNHSEKLLLKSIRDKAKAISGRFS